VTTRYERIKMQRRMQRRIRLVVEERRMSLAKPDHHAEPVADADTPVEITPPPPPAPLRAIGRVSVRSA
jgi:hypothetical protein